MLKLTLQQVEQVTGLSSQTLRHWRTILPPLAGLNGYTPCFSPGDALALLVVRYLVKVMGINVSALARASGGLFDLCRDTSWPHLADRQLIVDLEHGKVSVVSRNLELDDPAVLVPMRRFADQLQSAWESSFPRLEQLQLQLPPSAASRAQRLAAT